MSSKSTAKKVAVVLAKRFTFDKIVNFQHKGIRNLPELLSLFPNYGLGFKVFFKSDNEKEQYIIDKVNPINHRHADFYGLKYNSNTLVGNKIEKLKNTLKKGIWNFTIQPGKFVTDNGVEYDIKKTEELIEKKRLFLLSRCQLLDEKPKGKLIREDAKKKKLEAATVGKKKK